MELLREGSISYRKNDYKEAAMYYQRALDLEKKKRTLPQDLWRVLVDNLAMSYGIPGDLKKSKEVLEYGISQDPKYPNFYYTLACAYAEMNDLDHTISSLKTAFDYRANTISGETLPDPRKDDSFQRFMNEPRFKKLLASLPLKSPSD